MQGKKKSKKPSKKKADKIIKTDDLPKISFGEALRAITKAKKHK